MSKRKPSFRVDQVLPDDDRLGVRSNVWRTIMDQRQGFFRYSVCLVEERLRRCVDHALRVLRSVCSWFVLGGVGIGRRKRKLGPAEGEDAPGEPPPKFSKKEETADIDIDAAINSLDYEPSDDSQISDVVESGLEDDSDQENREELNEQLERVVCQRKPIWQETGLHKLMASIEDPKHEINMLSHEKVENWLLNRSAAAGSVNREISQGQETTILEKTVDGDRMKFHRKQHLTVSTKDDEDSMYSVDTAKYILSNKNKNSRSHIKVYKQVIKQYTMFSSDKKGKDAPPAHPKLHSISDFPLIPEEKLSLSTSNADVRHRSDSAIDTGTSMEQMSKLALTQSSSRAPASRKKVFKKTMKKKPTTKERSVTPTRSRTATKSSSPAQVMERALRNGAKVKKIPIKTRTTKTAAKNRRIHWKESSISGLSATRGSSQNSDSGGSSSSEDEENNEVFTRSKTRQKTPPKRETRRLPTRQNNASSNSESSPLKVTTPPQRQPSPTKQTPAKQPRSKNVEKDLVAPFEAISLSPRKRLDLTTNNTINQTTNMTALFSGANEKITNSTEINATTSNPGTTSFANSTASSRATRIPGFPDQSRCLVVYEPPQIQPELAPDARVRIQMADLNLTGVTKPRHLEKFAKFNYYIHPNSSVRFFPSDSEDDEPAPVPPISVNSSDDDISYDDDDPILTYNPRYTDRLNVVEVRHD